MSENKFKYIICPKCRTEFHLDGNSLKCKNGHSYDISSAGYVNLLPPHKKGTVPGDNKEMIRARHDFLQKNYYKPLADRLAEISKLYSPSVIADIGCGEGYYTSKLGNIDTHVIGFDISKFALAVAAKQDKKSDYCTANLHELPLAESTVDMVFCCFCAHDAYEFHRILKPNGKFILVTPAKKHLFGLKELLYDKPYENNEDIPELKGFKHVSCEHIEYTASIKGKQNIANLFAMTPYFWKTPQSGTDRLSTIEQLTTDIGFVINTYSA